jgi:hypothetical protein
MPLVHQAVTLRNGNGEGWSTDITLLALHVSGRSGGGGAPRDAPFAVTSLVGAQNVPC